MATPIPGFAAQVYSSGETAAVNGGSPAALDDSIYYYFVSTRTTTADGQSLLYALKSMLDSASSGLSTTWTVVLTKVSGVYRIQVSHNHASSRTITLSAGFASALGFASGTVVVATATTVTADYPSWYWWTPDMPVSLTNGFDLGECIGVPVSAGASQRAPDGTTAYVKNGVLYDADITFTMVEGLYLIKPTTTVATYTNRDLETFWVKNLSAGRRMLLWRDRDNATGSNAPSEGSALPYRYVEYAVAENTRKQIPAKKTTPFNNRLWDVTLELWGTENGDTPLTD